MINELQGKERKIATDLIRDGLDSASSTLANILKSPISIKKIDFGIETLKEVDRFNTQGESKFHLLRTELIGELKGVCHLVFTEQEVAKINQACLPKAVIESTSPEYNLLKMGFITELDNMVSAAVITQFSNFLGMDIYGHVPSLHVMPAPEVTEYLETESSKFNSIVHFKAIFQGEELEISPDFTWMFQDQFVSKIKELACLQ